MKALFSLMAIYLMTNGGGCEQASFIDDSRIVVEGKIIDEIFQPLKNVSLHFSNQINGIDVYSKNDGKFVVSTPITSASNTISFPNNQIVEVRTSDSRIMYYSSAITIPNDVNYVNLEIKIK